MLRSALEPAEALEAPTAGSMTVGGACVAVPRFGPNPAAPAAPAEVT